MYLDINNLELSVDFCPAFYEKLGSETFKYSFIELFDSEVIYSLTGSNNVTALPVLDVNTYEIQKYTLNKTEQP